ncbi:hypothetical protein RZE82_07405 [Mollicutes bacterium LVI A0039]|nr:hypothetical protein RZE82_07405 [Mollicutes bacterium LVI A0039]
MLNKSNNDNPFEVGGKRSKSTRHYPENNPVINATHQPESNPGNINRTPNPKKKSVIPKIIVGIIIGFIAIGFFDDLMYEVMWEFEKAMEKHEVNQLKDYIEEGYTYDVADFHNSFEDDPFPETMPLGEEFSISKEHEKFMEREDRVELTLIVGVDVKPGLYTIDYSRKEALNLDLRFDNIFPISSGTYYNIPLFEGDKIEASFGVHTEDFTTTFIPQADYVEFEPGIAGVFAYGRSNFETQIEFDKSDYGKIRYRYYNKKDDYLNVFSFYEEDVTIYGVPGSYFFIEAEDYGMH